MDKKAPEETVSLEFPYSDELGGATISSATVTNFVDSGVDSDPSLMLLGPASPRGGSVFQLYKLGVTGCIYRAVCLATLSDGRVLERVATVLVGSIS